MCIIEAMKLMNEIAAEEEDPDRGGLRQNGQIVEYGKPSLNFPEGRWKMNREEIMRIIPHRPPMLLVDEAEKKDENSCRGSYTVKGDEWFAGHFPGKPTVRA